MLRVKPAAVLDKTRRQIATRVRELRQSRNWTQAELAKPLELSQNRLSEIERGAGSFTAEQFLLLLKLFNVAASHFVSEPGGRDLQIQNALARLGALHLQESHHVLPSEQLEEARVAVREAVVDASPRVVTALAPVLVRNAERLNLVKLHAELKEIGLERRLAWIVANTLAALEHVHDEPGAESREWARLHRRAEVVLQVFLELVDAQRPTDQPGPFLDVLDATIRSRRTLEEVRRSASKISQRWGIITGLQPEDFLQALRAARASH